MEHSDMFLLIDAKVVTTKNITNPAYRALLKFIYRKQNIDGNAKHCSVYNDVIFFLISSEYPHTILEPKSLL